MKPVDLNNHYLHPALSDQCPNCNSLGLDIFYTLKNVPVHSVVLLRSKHEALSFPKGDIVLGYCEQCDFVSNLAFDSHLQDYSNEYESTQTYSRTFSQFNRRLADELLDRYHLQGKRIIEVGCGQGEFLSMLCENGNNSGIGFDPAYDLQRSLGPLPDRVKIIPDYFSERYAPYKADFICCKMTLEHIHPTLEFIGMIRKLIGDQTNTVVFFQIPNAKYVFGDLAFWDVYYEHCSYFSKGSIARLFSKSGFDVLDLWVDYQDQYLMIEAKPSPETIGRYLVQKSELDKLESEIALFARLVPQKVNRWMALLQEYHRNNQTIVLWGGGSKAVAFLTSLNSPVEFISKVVDINPNKSGTFLPGTGQEVIAPQQLIDIQPDVVIVMNPVYRKEILDQLEELNVRPRVITVEDF